jgi:hypothetical protein
VCVCVCVFVLHKFVCLCVCVFVLSVDVDRGAVVARIQWRPHASAQCTQRCVLHTLCVCV